MKIAVIAKQPWRESGNLWGLVGRRVSRLNLTAAGEKQVEITITVVVEHCHTAANRLQNQARIGLLAVFVGEMDAGFYRDILEPIVRSGRSSCR